MQPGCAGPSCVTVTDIDSKRVVIHVHQGKGSHFNFFRLLKGEIMSTSLPLVLPVQPWNSIAALRAMLCDSVVSRHTKRAYAQAFDVFFELCASTNRPAGRAVLMEYRAQMIDQGLSQSTINVRLSAIRKLTREARDNSLIEPPEAERIVTVPGVPDAGLRLGNWLTEAEARRLLAVPDRRSLIGKRGYAILSVLIYCALRREELATLDMAHIQKREGRWVIADLVGKRRRVRTVPLPAAAKKAIGGWASAARIRSGRIFRPILKNGRVLDRPLSAWTVWELVVESAAAAGIDHLGPHDLRRSCAKMCRQRGGELEQIQFLLGHESLATTQVYLGSCQEIRQAVNDRIHI